MRKIAVIFPGVGYTKDRPLLYYAGKLAAGRGYELIHMDFSGIKWSKEKLKDRDFLEETLKRCLKMTEDALAGVGDLADAEVVFISKSIGTVVATAYARKRSLRVKQICFSPLEMIGGYIEAEGAILFCADTDPYADFEPISRMAREKGIELCRIAGGNHSLETGDVLADIDNLKKMMKRVSELI